MDFLDFFGFFGFFWIFWIFFGFFGFLEGKKSLGQSPPQELEVGPRSGPYFLVVLNMTRCDDND